MARFCASGGNMVRGLNRFRWTSFASPVAARATARLPAPFQRVPHRPAATGMQQCSIVLLVMGARQRAMHLAPHDATPLQSSAQDLEISASPIWRRAEVLLS